MGADDEDRHARMAPVWKMRSRRVAILAGGLLVAGISIVGFGATAAGASTLGNSPASGPPGAGFTASGTIDAADLRSGCKSVTIHFDPGGPAIGTDTSIVSGVFSVAVKVPAGAAVGSHTTVALCDDTRLVARAAFQVTPPSTTTTTSTTKPTTTTSTTRPATTTTTRTGATTTTTRATITTAPTTTTTTLPGATTTTTFPTETTTLPGETTTTNPGGADITLDHPAITPGGDVTASGQGCDAGAPVTLTAGGHDAGATTADGRGRFTSPLDVRSLTPGRIQVVAVCGPTLTTDLDIVLASQVDTGTSTMIVLVFFVLIGAVVIRRQVRW